MKISILIAALALACGPAAWASESASAPTVEDVARQVRNLSEELQETQDQLADFQKRLDVVEQRLGDTYRPPSPFDTIEKRLEDLEDELGGRKRR